MRSSVSWSYSLSFLFLLVSTSLINAREIDAYFVDTLWPGDGPAIKNAVIVVENGTIQNAGPVADVVIPSGAKRHNLTGCSVMPGIVAMESSIGIDGTEDERNVTPEYRAIDAFDFYRDVNAYVASGITSVHVSPTSRRFMPGQSAMVKLGTGLADVRLLSESSGIKVVLAKSALNPPTVYEPPVGAVSIDRPLEPTRPQLGASYLELVTGLAALLESSQSEQSDTDDRLSTLASALKRKSVFRFTAESQSEIEAAIGLANRFELNWMLFFPKSITPFENDSLWKSTELAGIVLRPDASPGAVTNVVSDDDPESSFSPSWKNAAKLISLGLESKLAIQPGSDGDLREVMFLAKSFLRGGLSVEQVVKMLTANPAAMSGQANKIGVIKAGADADFIVLTGEPLRDGTEVVATYINGKREYQSEVKSSGSLFSAAQIYTPGGVVSDGMLTVANGKLIGVGRDVSIPTNAIRRHFAGGVIVPGMIDVGSQLGLGAPLTSQIGLETKLGNVLATDDEAIQTARKGGLTTAFLSSSQLPSPVVAFKLTDKPRVLKDPVAIRFALSGTVSGAEASIKRTLTAAKQYVDSWRKYEAEYAEYETKKKEYEEAKKKYDEAVKAAEAKKEEETKKAEGATPAGTPPAAETKPTDAPKTDTPPGAKVEPKPDSAGGTQPSPQANNAELKAPEAPEEPQKPREVANLEPYRALFAKQIVAMVEVKDDVLFDVAVRVFHDEFQLKLVIVGGDVAVKMADTEKKRSIPIVVGPTLTKTVRDETIHIPVELSLQSIPLLFQSGAAARAGGLADAISYSVYKGLGRQIALDGLSIKPSEIFQLNSVGALQVGRDADFVVLSGSPLDLASEVLVVVIDGQIVYEKDSQ
jgi:imidazolonepropionase-like amidohydrolase